MPFLPLGDENKRLRIDLPAVTWGLMGTCFLVFIYQEGISLAAWQEFVYGFGFIPAVLAGDAGLAPDLERLPGAVTLVTYQFLHGSWDHLLGNLLFLWIFGDNVEDAMGHLRFLAFYLLCGVLAGGAHYLAEPDSLVPLIGASGAISGVLGAYLLLHPFSRITVLLVFLPLRLPAWFLLLVWFGFQFVSLGEGGTEEIAWLAHIGGFLVGAALIPFFKLREVRLFARQDTVKSLRLPGGRRRRKASAPSAGQRQAVDPDERPRRRGPWG